PRALRWQECVSSGERRYPTNSQKRLGMDRGGRVASLEVCASCRSPPWKHGGELRETEIF
ncbi:MAG TPA: hypothetical protein PKA88_25495, partial [Polyangiaceae bacterium]|nr:hypothetical protein [Polyangiaceae bacterium]